MRWAPWRWAGWCAALCGIAFLGSTGLQPFYDDWVFPSQAALALRDGTAGRFLLDPIGQHWSPAWNLLAAVNLEIVGWHDDRLIRGLTLIVHAATLAWFVTLGRRLGLPPAAVAFGAAVLALHHVRAAAIYSFDTYSQVLADAASWLAGGLALIALIERRSFRHWSWLLAVLTPLGALAIKEQAAAGALAVSACLAAAWGQSVDAADRRRGAVLASILGAGVVAFAAARAAAGVHFADAGAYRLCLGCVPVNATLIGGALALPVRTLTVVDAWRGGDYATLVVTGASTAVFVLFLLVGLRSRDRGPVTPVLGLLALSVFPVALLGRVGELHAHTGVFWLALLVGLASDGWRRRLTRPGTRLALAGAAVIYVASLAAGLRVNLREMRTTGEFAASWWARYDAAIAGLPEGAVLLVRGTEPAKGATDYSLYRLSSPEFVVLMWTWIKRTPADDRIEVLHEWGDEPGDVGTRARGGSFFELRRRGEGLVIKPVTAVGPRPLGSPTASSEDRIRSGSPASADEWPGGNRSYSR